MKKVTIAAVAAAAMAFAGTASAALVPSVFDPGHTGCPVAAAQNGWLHLEKNCATTTNAAAGADITGLDGQTWTSASFTLKSTTQCQGGSPRFDIVTTTGTFFLGCNNVTPVVASDGTATYTFTPAALVAAGLPVPTGTITSADVLIDVQGVADVKNVIVNGIAQNLQNAHNKHKHHHDDNGKHEGDENGHHGHHQGGSDNDQDND
jgi:hypothetical protein